ncbi:Protein of unknown function [Pyronema omphalodes CBS 100304]|uniref:Uncharacterized protein n=1 Tax=Pyronema omphalodes (strain CBS 100304) TaxID=1076935 RepID=U4LEA2_PYROM|nr:Protein of unknown function [Pyronema omphalodes CBS 100304]
MELVQVFISLIVTVAAFEDVKSDVLRENDNVLPRCYTAGTPCGLGARCCPGFKCLGVPRRCPPVKKDNLGSDELEASETKK